jgi:hypothetical protein
VEVVRQSTTVGLMEVGTDEVLIGRWPLKVLPLIFEHIYFLSVDALRFRNARQK